MVYMHQIWHIPNSRSHTEQKAESKAKGPHYTWSKKKWLQIAYVASQPKLCDCVPCSGIRHARAPLCHGPRETAKTAAAAGVASLPLILRCSCSSGTALSLSQSIPYVLSKIFEFRMLYVRLNVEFRMHAEFRGPFIVQLLNAKWKIEFRV